MAGKNVDWKRVAARMNGVVLDYFFGCEKFQFSTDAFNEIERIYERAISREKATKSRKPLTGEEEA